MLILTDEREIAREGLCENCKLLKVGRQVETYGWMNESRGWMLICFDCFGPRIEWRQSLKHRAYWSPVK